jgi:hypothetical protein
MEMQNWRHSPPQLLFGQVIYRSRLTAGALLSALVVPNGISVHMDLRKASITEPHFGQKVSLFRNILLCWMANYLAFRSGGVISRELNGSCIGPIARISSQPQIRFCWAGDPTMFKKPQISLHLHLKAMTTTRVAIQMFVVQSIFLADGLMKNAQSTLSVKIYEPRICLQCAPSPQQPGFVP